MEISIEFAKEQSLTRMKQRFERLAARFKDLRPLWDKFVPFYHDTIVKGAFDTRGKTMGKSWAKYSPSYLRARKRAGFGGGQMLVLDGDLRDAARGNSNQKVTKGRQELTMEITGGAIPYAATHQYGDKSRNIPQRAYFFTEDDDIPARAYRFLIDELEKEFEGITGG